MMIPRNRTTLTLAIVADVLCWTALGYCLWLLA